jgi:hypothetical protein
VSAETAQGFDRVMRGIIEWLTHRWRRISDGRYGEGISNDL